VDTCYPKDSHISVEQAKRFIQHLKDNNIIVPRLKVDGGDPVFNPDFEEIIELFAQEYPELFQKIKVQSAYSKKVFYSKWKMPKSVYVRCEPQTRKNFKARHVPWFVSPTEIGVLKEGEIPPLGSWETKIPCKIQRVCGRSFERWGFAACPQEPVIGRLIGKEVHSKQHKLWADPDICRHCFESVGRPKKKEIQQMARDGIVPCPSEVFQFGNIKKIYDEFPKTHEPW